MLRGLGGTVADQMTDPAGIPALQEAIHHLHGVDAVHVATTLVYEQHQGQTVWRGDVETFDIIGHPKAKQAFAWSEATTGTRRRFFAVLAVPPIDSPAKAVQCSILADSKALEDAKRALD